MVALVEPSLAPDPVEALIARLDDPSVAASLHDLIDHVDLLAVLVVGLNGLISRGDTISDALADGVSEMRAVQLGTGMPDVKSLVSLAQKMGDLTGPLNDMLPTLEHLLRSDLGDTRVIDVAAMASRAVIRGSAVAASEQSRVSGVRALMKVLKDDDVARALGFVVAVVKALGQDLKAADPQTKHNA